MKLNVRPINTFVVGITPSKSIKPAYVNPTSFNVPAIFKARGPQTVVVRVAEIVIKIPKVPDIKIRDIRPRSTVSGFKNTS